MSQHVRASQFQDVVGGNNTDQLLSLPLEVPISCYKLVMEECRCDAQSMVFHLGSMSREQRTDLIILPNLFSLLIK